MFYTLSNFEAFPGKCVFENVLNKAENDLLRLTKFNGMTV